MAHHAPSGRQITDLHTLELLASFEPDDAPRSNLDPIRDSHDLLAVASLALHHPLRHETLVMLLDEHSCGTGLVTITGTNHPDDILEVARFFSDALMHSPESAPAGLAIVSIRPGELADANDPNRRAEIERILDPITLHDWLVLGESVRCVRVDDAPQE